MLTFEIYINHSLVLLLCHLLISDLLEFVKQKWLNKSKKKMVEYMTLIILKYIGTFYLHTIFFLELVITIIATILNVLKYSNGYDQ